MKQKIPRQEIIQFFSDYFTISSENIVIKKSHTPWISTDILSFGYTSEGYQILSKDRKFFGAGSKDGEPSPVEIIEPDRSEYVNIERFDEIIMQTPEKGKIVPLWSSIDEIEELLLRIRETSFLRVRKEMYRDGYPTGQTNIVGVYSTSNFIECAKSKFMDYASDIHPRTSFVFTFEIREPGKAWVMIPDPRAAISR